MKEMASIAAKHGKKAVLWDDTMGQPLLGQDGVVVQWWHAPHELAPLVKKVRAVSCLPDNSARVFTALSPWLCAAAYSLVYNWCTPT